jgi:HK97 family phage major capsid protein
MVAGFLAAVGNFGVFNVAFPDMNTAPLHSRIVAVTADATGWAALEGKAKPVSRLSFAADPLQEKKAVGLIVLSDDVLRFGAGAQELISRALPRAVASATDKTFIDSLIAANTPIAAAGFDAAGVHADLRLLLDAVDTGDGARLHVVMNSDTAKRLSVMATTGGQQAFPQMTPNGGTLCGIPAHVSDHADDNVLLFDATALVAASENVSLRSSSAAAVEMDDAPISATNDGGSPPAPVSPESGSPPAGGLVSLFQTDSIALLAERYFAFLLLRDTGVASLSGVQWGMTGSPPS